LPKPESIGVTKRKIIVMPCIEKSWSYCSGVSRLESGRASCIRRSTASRPPRTKKTPAVTR
jgi:hypothetical protein